MGIVEFVTTKQGCCRMNGHCATHIDDRFKNPAACAERKMQGTLLYPNDSTSLFLVNFMEFRHSSSMLIQTISIEAGRHLGP